MATESPVISSFKKRSIRPSNSSTSIRSLAASPSAVPVDDDDDEGQTAVFRPKARTTFAGQVRSRELGTLKKRLSFGGEVCISLRLQGDAFTDVKIGTNRTKLATCLVLLQGQGRLVA